MKGHIRRRDDAPSRAAFSIPQHVWWPQEGQHFEEWRAEWKNYFNTVPVDANIITPSGERFPNSIVGILQHIRHVRRTTGYTRSRLSPDWTVE